MRPSAGSRRPPWSVVALGAILVASGSLCLIALLEGWVTPGTIRELVARAGSTGSLAYIVAVVLMELFWLPRMWGLIAGGLLFGPLWGGLLSLVADLLGGAACYLLARGTGRDWVSGLLARQPRAARVVELLAEKRGAVTVMVLRMCPVAHYTLVSYAAGLSGVRPASFLLGTSIGLLPGAIVYPVMGDAALRPGSPTFIISLGIVVAALVVTFFVARRMLRVKGAE